MRLAAFLTVVLAAASAWANPESVGWQTNASRLRGFRGERQFVCPPSGVQAGIVYGTDVYALDSSLCAAAVHAGVIDANVGGTFVARVGAPVKQFSGSYRNGLASRAKGGEQWSFSVFPVVVAQPVPVPAAQPVPYPTAPVAPVPYAPPPAPVPYQPPPVPVAPVATPAPTPVPPMRVFQPGIAGQWRDTDGDLWSIPVDVQGDFDLAYRSRDGRRQQLFFARWLDGLVGTEFEARIEEDVIVVTYSPAMPDRIRVKMRGQKLFWTRQQ
jgi:hypothetical protein